jgi:ubiquinone/menaquinone biosynthesis C-methylase UbiE
METKDYFSGHSKIYAAFRPSYPQELYDFIFQYVHNKATAWDCATGNGQVAKILSPYFEKVFATDISQQQLENAHHADNIMYSVSAAEQTSFNENQFDLITVGQALHWFNLEGFYREVNRVGKNNSIIAVWGYANCVINKDVDKIFSNFYNNVVGPYWDSARRLVEQEYKNIPFSFEQIPSPKFEIKVQWTLDQFIGYLTSWSATQKYIKANQTNPVDIVKEALKAYWPVDETKAVVFPVFLKLGRINK